MDASAEVFLMGFCFSGRGINSARSGLQPHCGKPVEKLQSTFFRRPELLPLYEGLLRDFNYQRKDSFSSPKKSLFANYPKKKSTPIHI